MSKLHTILVFAQNKRGVLERITMLIRRKMYNLETITASDTEVEGIKRITITFSQGDADKIPQIVSQINKIVEVVEIKAVDSQHTVQREILLVKIARPQNLSEVTSLVDIFRGSVVDVSEKSVILQVAGDRHKTLGFLNALKQFQILEVGSSGIVAMEKWFIDQPEKTVGSTFTAWIVCKKTKLIYKLASLNQPRTESHPDSNQPKNLANTLAILPILK